MTNRDKLLSMSLYDMLVSMNTSGECCVIDSLGGIIEVVPQRCDHYANCSKCIEDFLNEGGNTKMYIGKKWMTESEVQAYVAELEKKTAEVEDKHLNENMQKRDYPNLRECPFCGGEVYNTISCSSQMIFAKVSCCKCMIEIVDKTYAGITFDKLTELNINVIDKWNRRAENENNK